MFFPKLLLRSDLWTPFDLICRLGVQEGLLSFIPNCKYKVRAPSHFQTGKTSQTRLERPSMSILVLHRGVQLLNIVSGNFSFFWRWRTDYDTSNFYKTSGKILSFTAVQWLSGWLTTDIIIAGEQMGMTWALWIMSFTTAFFYAGFRYY